MADRSSENKQAQLKRVDQQDRKRRAASEFSRAQMQMNEGMTRYETNKLSQSCCLEQNGITKDGEFRPESSSVVECHVVSSVEWQPVTVF